MTQTNLNVCVGKSIMSLVPKSTADQEELQYLTPIIFAQIVVQGQA